MTNDKIKAICLANGFKPKQQPDGSMDLNPYVYDAVNAAITDLKQGDDWISVKDALPEMHKRVLIKSDATFVAGRAPKTKTNADWGIKGDWFWGVVNDVWVDAHMVTHWQPLPKPPIGDDDD